ncbi:hypothetical protein MAPG_04732, partial [Magnaporthiopsis poae ATCC 64411]
ERVASGPALANQVHNYQGGGCTSSFCFPAQTAKSQIERVTRRFCDVNIIPDPPMGIGEAAIKLAWLRCRPPTVAPVAGLLGETATGREMSIRSWTLALGQMDGQYPHQAKLRRASGGGQVRQLSFLRVWAPRRPAADACSINHRKAGRKTLRYITDARLWRGRGHGKNPSALDRFCEDAERRDAKNAVQAERLSVQPSDL